MYRKAEKSVKHVLSKCNELVQKEFKIGYNSFVTKIHWEICRKYGVVVRAPAGGSNKK